jgi:hypothetical protein
VTYEELFDAYRQVVSQRDQLAAVGDQLWSRFTMALPYIPQRVFDEDDLDAIERWKVLRGIGNEPPLEDWAEC